MARRRLPLCKTLNTCIFLPFFICFVFFFASQAKEPLIFLISPMTSPVSNISKFQPLVNYLEKRLGQKILLKQRKSYQEINELLEKNKAHFAYVCTGGYIHGRKKFRLELLAIPVINGNTFYHAYIIVNKHKGFNSIEDLRGKIFAYTDPLSLSGYFYINSYLRKKGEDPKKFFRKTYFTWSHEKSLEAVAIGLADGASVESLLLDEMIKRKNPLTKEIKIIFKSPPLGIPPFVVSPSFPEGEKLKLLKILLTMDKDPEGKNILQRMGIDKFEKPDHTHYKSAIEIVNSALY